ncbi:MAG: sigma-54 dependent transcriptional regulator, partial [Thermodesulfobacteriota bacterium]|nr:sigma-54 dependent transcriptional regulator [Thermodesulfobacteriota bacterium]
VMITAYGSIDTAVDAMKKGACDYVLKPFDPEEISMLIHKIIKRQQIVEENILLKERFKEESRFENLIGQSKPMQEVFKLIIDVAKSDSTVLITGQSGTGKELVAKAIHAKSSRCYGPFVVINCGALTESLLESELFGHEKGAFTDAMYARKGRFEMADGGTLFLDEIGEISMKMQIDLLRVLEEKKIRRVGGTELIDTDARIIAATNRDLKKAIEGQEFRKDLFYRLNVISINLPDLNQRKEDLPLLAMHFLRKYVQKTNKKIDSISPDAMNLMLKYDWPGNVRELENAIERAVVIGKTRKIISEDLPFFRHDMDFVPKGKSIREWEKAHILQILEESQWNISHAAKILEIDRATLYHKIKKYGLNRPGN